MLVFKKSAVFNEMALAVHLLLEHSIDNTTYAAMQRIRERAEKALEAAAPFTANVAFSEAADFLDAHTPHFSTYCGSDIVKGDIIRFEESARDKSCDRKRHNGRRGIIAEVVDMHQPYDNPTVYLRILTSGGTHHVPRDSIIRRHLNDIARSCVIRTLWKSEKHRKHIKDSTVLPKPTSKTVPPDIAWKFGNLHKR